MTPEQIYNANTANGCREATLDRCIAMMEEYAIVKQRELLSNIAETFRQGVKDNKLSLAHQIFALEIANNIEKLPLS